MGSAKYIINGKSVWELLNYERRDYNYFLTQIKKGKSVKSAYKKTINTGKKSFGRLTKYIFDGKPLKYYFSLDDCNIFYKLICYKKNMTPREVFESVKRTIRNREKRWKECNEKHA